MIVFGKRVDDFGHNVYIQVLSLDKNFQGIYEILQKGPQEYQDRETKKQRNKEMEN